MRIRQLVVVLAFAFVPSSAFAQFASEADRREAMLHYREGRELMSAERFEQAAEAFQRSIAKDPLLTLAHHSLGEAYMALRRYASAVKAFTDCREAFRTLHGLRERDRFVVERQRNEEVRELRDTIRRMQAMGPEYQLNVARLEGRIEDLERQRKTSTEPFVTPPELSLALGSAHFRNGDRALAEENWLESVKVNPKQGEAWNNLAAIYLTSGRKQQAEDAVRNAERSGFRVNPRLKDDIKAMPSAPTRKERALGALARERFAFVMRHRVR